MTVQEIRKVNQASLTKLKPEIDRTYPLGRFVAIHQGRVVEDAASFDELDHALDDRGFGQHEVLVVQAGINEPDYLTILPQGLQP